MGEEGDERLEEWEMVGEGRERGGRGEGGPSHLLVDDLESTDELFERVEELVGLLGVILTEQLASLCEEDTSLLQLLKHKQGRWARVRVAGGCVGGCVPGHVSSASGPGSVRLRQAPLARLGCAPRQSAPCAPKPN